MPMLTDAEMADHHLTYSGNNVGPAVIWAAYVTTEDKHPDMLAFKDCEHRTLALVQRAHVIAVERIVPKMATSVIGEAKTISAPDPAKYAATLQPGTATAAGVQSVSTMPDNYTVTAVN